MKIIQLNSELSTPAPIVYNRDPANYQNNYTRANYASDRAAGPFADWRKELKPLWKYGDELPYEIIQDQMVNDGEMIGLGFLSHLSRSYSAHHKIAVNPQDFWFIMLTEIAAIIGKDPAKYADYFTDSDEKKDILVPGVEILPIDFVVEQLEKLIPGGATKFLPKFTTSTPDSDMAIAGALLHTVKHYYNYMMFCCGIPEIKVNGTAEDWTKFGLMIADLKTTFEGATEIITYLEKVHLLIRDLYNFTFKADNATSKQFWEGIFSSTNIGSGSQKILSGWMSRLYTPRDDQKVENFEKSLAVIPYSNVSTGQEYLMVIGGFIATPDSDGFFTTKYSAVVGRKK